jgi:hypothetical protein
MTEIFRDEKVPVPEVLTRYFMVKVFSPGVRVSSPNVAPALHWSGVVTWSCTA